MLPENRLEFFRVIFNGHTAKFNWPFNDQYTEHPVGQFGFGFSLYLLNKFGAEEHLARFYAEKYLRAFPHLLNGFPDRHFSTKEELCKHCYSHRTVDNFFNWFGLMTIERSDSFSRKESDKFKRTDLFKQIFLFD